jgi:hypothetical protein
MALSPTAEVTARSPCKRVGCDFDCSCDIVVELVRASKGCADPNGLQFTRRDLGGGFIPEPCRS